MIRRFEWIRDSGIFHDFRWDSTTQDLEKINVIYGANGSGKSSLARALDEACRGTDGYQRLSLQVEDSGLRYETDGANNQVFDRLYVFCESYVDRNLRFHESSPNLEAILTLGERTVEAKAKISDLIIERGLFGNKFNKSEKESRDAKFALEKLSERVSTEVVRHLSRVNEFRSRSVYHAGKVRDKYQSDRANWKLLTETEFSEMTNFVASDNKEEVERKSFSLAPAVALKDRVESLLAARPVSILLNTLTSHPEATSWVQEGFRLHGGLDACLFCDQPLPKNRLQDIERHFSDEVADLQRQIDELCDDLTRHMDSCGEIILRIPNRGLLFEELRSPFDEADQNLRVQLTAAKDWADGVLQLLRVKRENVISHIDGKIVDPPEIGGSEMNEICEKHNDLVKHHDQLVETYAHQVERHLLKSEEVSFDELDKNYKVKEEEAALFEERFNVLQNEITALENIEGDPMPSADILTRELSRLLGRDELLFESRDGGYAVTRNGQPAVGLSVGERSAIALIHFLLNVANHDYLKGDPIVVIDDPVSSLDSNVLMGISTSIWTATVNDQVEQLILLTHNFDLFKQWDVQLESLHRDHKCKAKFPACLFEFRSRHISTNGQLRRQPVFVSWPESEKARKKVRSSYHHAFISVVKAKQELLSNDSLESRLDAQLLFPNVIRRILESFLAFKRPEWAGNFTTAMRNSADLLVSSGYKGDANALRQQLTRYAHAYSHSESPETNETISPDEIGSVISMVFTFMDQLDHDHFVGLCEVIEVDPESLLPSESPMAEPAIGHLEGP